MMTHNVADNACLQNDALVNLQNCQAEEQSWCLACVVGLVGVLQEKGGILPALQKLSYAGKRLADSQRTLQQ
jgi:hypothetical protein